MAALGLIIMGSIAWMLGLGFVGSIAEEHFGKDAGMVAGIGYIFLTGLAFYVFG